MNRRSIGVAKNVITSKCEDYHELFIGKTPYPIHLGMKNYQATYFYKDMNDNNNKVKIKSNIIEGVSHVRKPYIVATYDGFDMVRSLSKKGYMLFKYIILNIKYDSNKIVLTTKDVAKIIDCDIYTVISRTIHELIKIGIIAKADDNTSKNIYVINHNDFFKGNYTKFINDYKHTYLKGSEYAEDFNCPEICEDL